MRITTLPFRLLMIVTVIVTSSMHLNAQQRITDGYYQYETTCINEHADGSLTLKSFGKGRNRKAAITDAKKNAIQDLLFKGILRGSGNCNPRPLITEVNVKDKYEDYFSIFFSDKNGLYQNYISSRNERIYKRIFRNGFGPRDWITFEVTIRVYRNELRSKLIEDGIIK